MWYARGASRVGRVTVLTFYHPEMGLASLATVLLVALALRPLRAESHANTQKLWEPLLGGFNPL